MITNENYEGYLMRYADGELSAADAAAVEAFLDEHPELREELEEITAPSLPQRASSAPLLNSSFYLVRTHRIPFASRRSGSRKWLPGFFSNVTGIPLDFRISFTSCVRLSD